MQTNLNYLNQYFELITSNQIQNEKIRWIYQSAYNYMYSAYLLAQNGLKNQAHNSARIGLEFHWVGLLLSQDDILLRSWCLGIGETKKKINYSLHVFKISSGSLFPELSDVAVYIKNRYGVR